MSKASVDLLLDTRRDAWLTFGMDINVNELDIHEAFKFHKLNKQGQDKALDMALAFNAFLEDLDLPEGRYKALVITKLEEACFFAKKSMATDKSNQE